MSSVPRLEPAPLVSVRESRLHGLAVFALRRIARGTRVIEDLGERLSPVLIQQPASIHACT